MRIIYAIFLLLPIVQKAYSQSYHLVPNREYRYRVKYNNDSLGIHTSELVTIMTTGKPWLADSNQNELKIKYSYTKKDSLMCASLPTAGWSHGIVTGIVDSPNRLWMHPIRANQYMLLQVSPFPEIHFPLTDSTHYRVKFNTSGGWDYLSGAYLTSDYKVVRKEIIRGVLYWRISATATFTEFPYTLKQGLVNTVDFVFSETEGFYSYEYHFFDKTYMTMAIERPSTSINK